MEDPSDIPCLRQTQQHALDVLSKQQNIQPILPNASQIQKATTSLQSVLPDTGMGVERTTAHVLNDLVPAMNGQSLSPNYYGFVVGGITPAARIAETVVSTFDQNAVVHLPDTTIATSLEDQALKLLLQLLDFDAEAWPGGTFTTGATAGNIIGLACGREYVVNEALRRRQKPSPMHPVDTVGDIGLVAACRGADITDIQVLTTLPHSSLKKAASIVGLGRSCFPSVSKSADSLAFDLQLLGGCLKKPHTASIVVISCAEVNTGLFATHSYDEVEALRKMCDHYGAWLHVDAAFGLFARVLTRSEEFEHVQKGTHGLELADSIAGDGHKLLNVPYDCGFFFSRHATIAHQVFQNPNAAYLNAGEPGANPIQSPLNIGLENSRRFRALPVYATLISYGRAGYREMLERQIRFARRVACYFAEHPDFDLLPEHLSDKAVIDREVYIIVLFRARDDTLNRSLGERLNATSKIYVSGTTWQGRPACRIAAANWQIQPERNSTIVQEVTEQILKDWRQEHQ
ncbi:MAG: hypothetical protein Q9220_000626 [cf. Caloplaca sp. 1 TL-2023]